MNRTDSLSKVLPGWGLTEREVAWLWLVLEIRERIQMDECQLNSQTMRDQIAGALRRNPRVTMDLVRARDCGFRGHPATYSMSIRPPIPR